MKYALVGLGIGIGVVATVIALPYVTSISPRIMSDNYNQEMQEHSQGNALERSRNIIEAILKDLSVTYRQTGGGGISNIKQTSTNTFEVSISQEGRVDVIVYEVETEGGGEVHIKDRKENTRTF